MNKAELKKYAVWLLLRRYDQISKTEAERMDLEEILYHLELTQYKLTKQLKGKN